MNTTVKSNDFNPELTKNKTINLHKSHRGVALETLLPLLEQTQDINYWRNLNPNSKITNRPFDHSPMSGLIIGDQQLNDYQLQLKEERYFQTKVGLPPAATQEMYNCIGNVRKAGLPPGFALIYDVFYRSIFYFDSVLTAMLGSGYKLFPSPLVFGVDPTDTSQGFTGHRDGEYVNTIDANGMPTILTLWIAVTDAKPLNSCIYVLPANRDPNYKQAITNPEVEPSLDLQDIRALPTSAGTLTCWDQYIFHWGSRSSKRASSPRISYACYCQRGDIPPFDNRLVDVPSELSFESRLSIVYKTFLRYCYSPAHAQKSEQFQQLLESMKNYIKAQS